MEDAATQIAAYLREKKEARRRPHTRITIPVIGPLRSMAVPRRRLVLLVPLPRKDQKDRPVPLARHRTAVKKLLKTLGRWFRGSTALPSWGSWKESDPSLRIDLGQTAVLVMTTTEQLRKRRPALKALLEKLGRDLNQKQMAAMVLRDEGRSLLVRGRR